MVNTTGVMLLFQTLSNLRELSVLSLPYNVIEYIDEMAFANNKKLKTYEYCVQCAYLDEMNDVTTVVKIILKRH